MALNFNKEDLQAAFCKHAEERGKGDRLDLVEFGQMLTEIVGHGKLTVPQIQDMFEGVCGGDDQLTFEEFWTGICAKPATNSQLEDTFDQWDKDNSGALSKDELCMALLSQPNITEEYVQVAMDKADPNDDGKITKAEFMKCFE